VQDNKAERTVDALAACQLPEDSTEIRAAALSPTLRGSRGGPDAVPPRLRPRPDTLDPGFHCVPAGCWPAGGLRRCCC